MIACNVHSSLWGSYLGGQYVRNGECCRKKNILKSPHKPFVIEIHNERLLDWLRRKRYVLELYLQNQPKNKNHDCLLFFYTKKQPMGWCGGLRLAFRSFPNRFHSINCLYVFIITSYWRLLFIVRKISLGKKNEE